MKSLDQLTKTWAYGVSALAMSWAAGGSAAAAAPAQGAQAGQTMLGEIVVTAEKRAERLQDVPVSVAAVTPETLAKTGIDSTATLPTLVPGLTLNATAFSFRPFLRGVGTSASNAGNENSVATYIDNIYLTSMNAGLLNLSNIESVEVLKGPQGTLFGRNATGGVINIKTRTPSHHFGGDASLSYGSYNTFTATSYVTGGLTDTVAADLAIYYRNQANGYGINLTNGHDVNLGNNFAVRSKILFEPTSTDKFILSADYSHVHDSGQTYSVYPGFSVNAGLPDATHPYPLGAPTPYPGGKVWNMNVANDPFQYSWYAGASLTYTHEFTWATLSSFTAFRKDNVELGWQATPAPANTQYVHMYQPEQQFSQEVQLSSLSSSKVKWIVGAYYLNAWVKYDPFVNAGINLAGAGPVPTQQQFRMKQSINSPAIYGQFTAPIEALGDTNFTGGLRYTIDKRSILGEIEIVRQANIFGVPVAINDPSQYLRIINPTDASKTYRNFTWRLALDHHFGRDVLAYASYNRGFKAGAYGSIPPGGPTAKPTNPEILDAYEIGVKNTLLGGRATLNLAAFLYNYKDLQVTLFSQGTAQLTNAASARIKGVDLDFNAQLTDQLRVSVGAELLDAKFVDYPAGPIYSALPLSAGGGLTRVFGSLAGYNLPYSSKAAVNGGLFYEAQTPVGEFDANTEVSWNDGFSFDPSAVAKQKPYVQLNATLGLTLNNETTRLSIFGRNLTNDAVVTGAAVSANPGGYVEAQYLPPRTFGFSISQKF